MFKNLMPRLMFGLLGFCSIAEAGLMKDLPAGTVITINHDLRIEAGGLSTNIAAPGIVKFQCYVHVSTRGPLTLKQPITFTVTHVKVPLLPRSAYFNQLRGISNKPSVDYISCDYRYSVGNLINILSLSGDTIVFPNERVE